MHRIPLIMAVISDIAGQVRGKGFPATERDERLEKGVGYTFTNHMINCWGQIPATPWGPLGDMVLMPDPATEVEVDFGDGSVVERFMLGSLYHMDGTPWDCCLRNYLRSAVMELERETGLMLIAAFEHEFNSTGMRDRTGDSYSLDKIRLAGEFPEAYLYALRAAEAEPETFLPEFGANQFEITVKPGRGVAAADRAIVVRELARAAAERLGHRVSFSPKVDPNNAGNGVHIHMSFRDRQRQPVAYDPDMPHGVSALMGSFVAGILRRLPSIIAVTAPSAASYQRLNPHSWSSTYNNLGHRDREAAVRICPVSDAPGANVAAAFNVEFRAGDAAASPYLQLGILVRAGLEGIRDKLPLPETTSSDPDAMTDAERAAKGVVRLPTSLSDALDALEAAEGIRDLIPGELFDAYVMHKRGELAAIDGLDDAEICRRYAEVY
ncbi:MAG: glutamine synthetase family protein [Alphaproteobacteria bacterium]|nr:glutamine synthetase [Rhodospirillaceae bacterium]MBT7613501.1 glutamine synthetase [Rhodospirillaceae bacterium]MBT7645514.1 glutamine synthetase [Rhodospirillaceae bacterium]MDG2481512.1 glutamine synthetase family protein [Alphaproteobacteria bacterium]